MALVVGPFALAAMSTVAVHAQPDPCGDPTDPSGSSTTTTSTTTIAGDPTPTTTTVVCPVSTTTTTTLPPLTAPPPPPDPGQPTPPSGPATTTPVPTTSTTIEELPVHRVGHYADQPELTHRTSPDHAALGAARRTRDEAVAVLDAATAEVARLEADLATQEQAIGALAAAEQVKADELLIATEEFETRVVDAYVRGRPVALAVLEGSDGISDVLSKIVMLEQVLAEDQESLGIVEALRDEVGDAVAESVEQLHRSRGDLAAAKAWIGSAETALAEAEFEIDVWEANSDVYVRGYVFPVAARYSFIDSWGFPRGPGTPWDHWHEGADIFAPTGTELLAAETGVISRLSTGGRGGLALYIEGESGSKHYYAHLTHYAEGIREGAVVTAGDVVGFVGDSGNARGGLPHLHYEIHPGDRPVNPYALLATAVRRDAATLTALLTSGEPASG